MALRRTVDSTVRHLKAEYNHPVLAESPIRQTNR